MSLPTQPSENQPADAPAVVLRLFVASGEPNSNRALSNVRRVCEGLRCRFRLEVIDVLADYQAALEEKIFAVPTLVVEQAACRQVIIGTLDDPQALKEALGWPPPEKQNDP